MEKRRLALVTGNETASEQAPPQQIETGYDHPALLRRWELKMRCLTLCGVEIHEKRMVSFLFKVTDLEKRRGLAALVRDLGYIARRVSSVHLSVENSEPVSFNTATGVCRATDDDPATDLRLVFSLSASFENVISYACCGDIWFDLREPAKSLDEVINRYLDD